MFPLRISVFAILMSLVASHTVNYHFHQRNGDQVNECVQEAIARMARETCLAFEENSNAHDAILILESSRCGFQETNSTVHLDSNCLTTDSCVQFLSNAISGEKKHHSTATRHLNLKFNCTEKCTRDCGVGGKVKESDCSCVCDYGFTGANCERLKLAEQFTDSGCGFIDALKYAPNGVISLKGQAGRDTYCQWVLKSDDPFHTFELEVEELDLDDENVPPQQTCGDSLYIYGLKEHIQNPVPCVSESVDDERDDEGTKSSASLLGKTFHSKGNMIFIEYRGNGLPSRPHKGPTFKYSTVRQQLYNNEFPSMKYEHVTAAAGSSNKFFVHTSLAISTTVLLATILSLFY